MPARVSPPANASASANAFQPRKTIEKASARCVPDEVKLMQPPDGYKDYSEVVPEIADAFVFACRCRDYEFRGYRRVPYPACKHIVHVQHYKKLIKDGLDAVGMTKACYAKTYLVQSETRATAFYQVMATPKEEPAEPAEEVEEAEDAEDAE